MEWVDPPSVVVYVRILVSPLADGASRTSPDRVVSTWEWDRSVHATNFKIDAIEVEDGEMIS